MNLGPDFDADAHNHAAGIRYWDHMIAATCGEVDIVKVWELPRERWLDWVGFLRMEQAKQPKAK